MYPNISQTNVEEYHSKTTHPGWIYANYHFLTVGIVSVKSVITGHKHDNSYAYLLLLHCCRLGWLSITAWLQETVKSPKRSQRDSNSSENSSCFAVEIRVTLENHGKTLENHGKHWKIMEKHWKIMENIGKTLENHGKHWKFLENVGNSWKNIGNCWKNIGNSWKTLEVFYFSFQLVFFFIFGSHR